MTRFLLDTTVLIAHLRGDTSVRDRLLQLLIEGHTLSTSCVNIAEVEHGLRDPDRKRASALLNRLGFLLTTREAAERAGRYQAYFRRRGRIIDTPDALVAGTARAHGAVLVTDNVDDFPMSDLWVESLPSDT